MQVLYGILVQHFANRAGLEPPALKELDVLTAQLLDLTPTVPLYAATVALARLKRLQESLLSAGKQHSECTTSPCSLACLPAVMLPACYHAVC